MHHFQTTTQVELRTEVGSQTSILKAQKMQTGWAVLYKPYTSEFKNSIGCMQTLLLHSRKQNTVTLLQKSGILLLHEEIPVHFSKIIQNAASDNHRLNLDEVTVNAF
ncbi:hypothetical protein ATANTOWER_026762 [Ataeniobius toweri]|uniref:Uncharacterized protein n=1 Tax=Ataeniobius toweri TaxID=208326 RepID=A0ABU7C419_9TELE|nr:hypothetical protein [Ataeniobius toweri]